MTVERKDLVVLVADADIEQTVHGLLKNPERLGISSIDCDILRHLERDPGCARRSVEFLRPFCNQYAHALVIFDHEGSGREAMSREELEHTLEEELARNGWAASDARVVVLEPELETWIWSRSDHVAKAMGWNDWKSFSSWLVEKEWLKPGETKPIRPKEAMLAVLRDRGLPRSASRFRKLAENVGHGGCQDPSFGKLRETLREWFQKPLDGPRKDS